MSAVSVVMSALEYLETDWDGSELLLYTPKVLLRHYIGDEGACTLKSASVSDNILTSHWKLCDFVEMQR